MPESYKDLPKDKCIDKMISYLSDKHPSWSHEKVVAVAHSECGASRQDAVSYLLTEEEMAGISGNSSEKKRRNPQMQVFDQTIQRGKHSRCIDRLKYIGFSEEEARMICATVFLGDTKLFGEKHEPTERERKAHKYRYDPRTRHTGGHPTHVEIGVVPRPMALPIQAPHRPPKSEHIMRTKMEEIQTLEERFLTLEQLAKRAEYQKQVQKTGKGVKGTKKFTLPQGITKKEDAFYDTINSVLNVFPDYSVRDAVQFALDNELIEVEVQEKDIQDAVSQKLQELTEKLEDYNQDEIFADAVAAVTDFSNMIYSVDNTVFDSVNNLNNVKKIPVTLAKEMVQEYGEMKHFKPYKELKNAIGRIDELPVIIEHKRFSDNDIVGYVKELRADDKDRAIKGFAYLTESRLPSSVLDLLDNNEIVPVSIGFFAEMGNEGEYNGEKYDATQENIQLNHLAICMRSKARCPPDKCGLNVDSVVDGLEDAETGIIKKKEYYYNIGKKEEKRKNINHKEERIEMDDANQDVESQEDAYIPESHQKIFSKLNKLLNFLPIGERQDAIDYIAAMLADEEDEDYDEEQGEKKGEQDVGPDEYKDRKKDRGKKMTNDAELKAKIKELEDSLKEKEEELEDYKEKERKHLIDSITEFSVYKEDELEDKCINELRVIEDAVSRFEPSNAKPKIPKPREDKDFEDSEYERIKPESIFSETNKSFGQ